MAFAIALSGSDVAHCSRNHVPDPAQSKGRLQWSQRRNSTRAHSSADTDASKELAWRTSLLVIACCCVGRLRRRRLGTPTGVESPVRRRAGKPASRPSTLLNVSYDPTRELYVEFNKAFAKHWQEETGPGSDDRAVARRRRQAGPGGHRRPEGRRRHAGARLRHRSDRRAQRSLLPADWQDALAEQQLPVHVDDRVPGSQGQSEGDQGLERPGEGRRRSHHAEPEDLRRRPATTIWPLGATHCKQNNNDEAKAREFVTALYKNVPVLDSGARGSTTTFVQRGIGDVLLAWENEALLAIKELGPDKVEMVVPSMSILAEPPVTVVDKNAEAHGATEVAKAYLEYLYSPAGQKIAAKHYYRPSEPELRRRGSAEAVSRSSSCSRVDEVFGSWKEAQDKHFNDGGMFDSIYAPQVDSATAADRRRRRFAQI